MIKFIIIRHGESKGNKSEVIQGHNECYKLTEEGVRQIRKTSLENTDLLQEVDMVFSSDLDRAIETAHGIIDELQLKVPCLSTELLREVNPGVLGGLSHQQASEKEADYYSIWLRRGDLDGIPGAEKGTCLQARAITFIQHLSDCYDGKTVLVVTHAAFMRSLINTLLGIDRTSPVCVSNGQIHVITNERYLSQLELIVQNSRKQVHRYQAFEQQFAIKTLINPSKDRTDIYSYFSTVHNPNLPYIYYSNTIGHRFYVVTQWIDGEVVHGPLSKEEVFRAWDGLSEIHKSFANNHFSVHTTLLDKINEYQITGSQAIKKLGNLILNLLPLSMEDDVPVFYDLHRDNYIRTQEGWKLVDIEGVLMAPAEFSAACFMAAFLMLENPNLDISPYYSLLSGKSFDINKSIMLICFRLYIGLSYANASCSSILIKKYKSAIYSWLELALKNGLIENNDAQNMKFLLSQIQNK